MRVLGPRGAELLEQRSEDALVAGQRAGVGDRGRRARPRPAGLEHRHADPRRRGLLQRRAPALAVAVGLQIQGHAAHAVALAQRVEEVRGVEHGLVAAGDDGVQPQPAARGERVDRDVAGLRDQRDRAGLARLDRVAPERDAVGQRDDPVAVRPAHRQPVGGDDQPRLQVAPRAPPRTRRRTPPPRRSRARGPGRRRPAPPAAGIATTTASGASGRSSSARERGDAVDRAPPGIRPRTSARRSRAARG